MEMMNTGQQLLHQCLHFTYDHLLAMMTSSTRAYVLTDEKWMLHGFSEWFKIMFNIFHNNIDFINTWTNYNFLNIHNIRMICFTQCTNFSKWRNRKSFFFFLHLQSFQRNFLPYIEKLDKKIWEDTKNLFSFQHRETLRHKFLLRFDLNNETHRHFDTPSMLGSNKAGPGLLDHYS